MSIRKTIVSMFFIVLTVSSAFCTSLAIEIVQDNPGQEEICQTSMYFEQSVIDFFFESGHIISNSPIYISVDEKKDSAQLAKALSEAADGYLSYFTSINIEYDTEKSSNPEAPLLENIKKVTWKTYSAQTGKQIAGGSAVPEKITTENDNEIGITNFASLVAAKISAGLGK